MLPVNPTCRLIAPALGLWLAAGCAGAAGPRQVTPAEQAVLQADEARFAADPEMLTRIGIRYYEGRLYRRARDVLRTSLILEPGFSAAVYLGLAEEALGAFGEAEQAYRSAGAMPISRSQRTELERRLAGLGRARLTAEAREAIARESTLSGLPPVPNSIAVLPWTYIGEDRGLEGLGYGIAQLVLTDLGKIERFTLIERERVTAMLDEVRLTEQGRVDSVTAVRSGRLLRAARVVHGVVRQTPGGIRIEASVFRTSDASVEASGGASDRVERLFDLEKQVVLDLVAQMGITLTPAEQRALSERPMADLRSFLVQSQRLEDQDRGVTMAGATPEALARVADPSMAANFSGPGGALLTAMQVIAPTTWGDVDGRSRTPVTNPRLPEALGKDNPARIAIIGDIIIIIPRP
jgi:TolB-like protein